MIEVRHVLWWLRLDLGAKECIQSVRVLTIIEIDFFLKTCVCEDYVFID